MRRLPSDIDTRLWGTPVLRTALEGNLRRVKTPRDSSLSGTVLLVTLLLFGSSSPVAPMAEARGLSSRTYSVGGTVSDLSGGNLVLVNNETEALSLSSNGPFRFTLTSSAEAAYSVLLSSQPSGQVCTVANGSGVITNADITDVTVACAPGTEATLYAFSRRHRRQLSGFRSHCRAGWRFLWNHDLRRRA